jgi:hypothetical protein
MATRLISGAISKSKSNILLPIAASDVMKPVIFPPGRGSPSTNPSPTGSVTTTNTIGIVRVSRLCCGNRCSLREDQIGLRSHQLFRECPDLVDVAAAPPNLDPQIGAVHPT